MGPIKVKIPSGGLTLEGEWLFPEGKGPFPAVVVSHPFPPQGGSMHSSVVTAIWETLAADGIAALRFNFRGTGQSEGRFADGIGEIEDVKAAFEFALNYENIDPDKVALAGYSFGAMMSVPVALDDERVHSLAIVSAPLPGETWKRLDAYKKPYLVVVGENDHMVSMDMYRARKWGDVPVSGQYRMIRGGDHFLNGQENDVAGTVSTFFSTWFEDPDHAAGFIVSILDSLMRGV